MDKASYRPVFIGGVERSGTSLLYALLASHPNLAMTRRTNLWPFFYKQYGSLVRDENLDRLLSDWRVYRRVSALQPDLDALRLGFLQGERSYSRLFALLWEQYAQRVGKPRWGDKSLNTERYADVIFKAFPEARILHIVRDPRDRFASALKRWKVIRGGPGSGAAMWLDSVRIGYRNIKKYSGKYRFIQYESLTSHPEAMMREVCDFIDEPFDPIMLSMQAAETFRDEGGNSSFVPHEPGTISTGSIGRYRKYLSTDAIAFIQSVAGREMELMGYSLDKIEFSSRQKLGFNALARPKNTLRMIAWQWREAYLDRVGRPIPESRWLVEAGESR